MSGLRGPSPEPKLERKAEFRRGWRALVGATVGIGAGVAIVPAYTNGLVVGAFHKEFGWSLSQMSFFQLIASVVLILTAPAVGAMVDRLGVRIPGAIAMAVLGVSYFLLSLNGGSFPAYIVVFTLMYLLASPSTAVSFTRAVNERFDRSRGIALGICLSGAGLVAFLIPQLLGTILAENWRAGYRILGFAVLVAAVVVLLVMPRTLASTQTATVARAAKPVPRSSIAPLVRSGVFARLAVAYFLLSLGVTWLALFLVSLLRDAGAAPGAAAQTVSLVGLSLILSRLVVGLLVDHFFAPHVGAGVLLLTAVGLLTLLLAGPSFGWAGAVAAGFALGAEVDLIGNLTSRYFDLPHYSRMFGMFYAVATIGTGISPLIAARLREATGSYTLPLVLSVALLVLAAALLATAPRFKTHHSVDTDGDAEPVAERFGAQQANLAD